MALQHFGEQYENNAPVNYERFFVPAIGAPLARDLVNRAMIQPGERVLDVACGTGIVARTALKQTGKTGAVAGLDINPGMLAVAQKVSPHGIVWYRASAEEIPAPDHSFDVVLCQISLMFVPDKLKALNEMYRVLVPNGRLFVTAPGPASPVWENFIESLHKYIGQEAAGFVSRVFSLHNAEEVQQLLADAKFKHVSVSNYLKKFELPKSKDFLWQYVKSTPLDAFLSGAEENKLSAFENELVSRWSDFEKEDHLVDQLNIMVASARK